MWRAMQLCILTYLRRTKNYLYQSRATISLKIRYPIVRPFEAYYRLFLYSPIVAIRILEIKCGQSNSLKFDTYFIWILLSLYSLERLMVSLFTFENNAAGRHLGFASSVRSIFFGFGQRVGKSKQTALRCFPVWEKRVRFLKNPGLLVQQMRACTVKKVIVFPVPSRDVTNQTLPGRELLTYSRPGRVWLVTTRLGTGKSTTFFTVQEVTKRSGFALPYIGY